MKVQPLRERFNETSNVSFVHNRNRNRIGNNMLGTYRQIRYDVKRVSNYKHILFFERVIYERKKRINIILHKETHYS